MTDKFYPTLTEAMQDIANRSFYEDANVVPCAPITGLSTGTIVGYLVTDDTSHATDDWTWTYNTGVQDRDSVSETTRLFDPAETWTDARHIYNGLPETIEYLEDGKGSVTFAYAVVYDGDADRDDDDADDIAGWIAVAIHYDAEMIR